MEHETERELWADCQGVLARSRMGRFFAQKPKHDTWVCGPGSPSLGSLREAQDNMVQVLRALLVKGGAERLWFIRKEQQFRDHSSVLPVLGPTLIMQRRI